MRVGYEIWIGDFRPSATISAKRCKIRQSYMLITRKSKSTTLVDPEMTLGGNYALYCIYTHVFRSQPLKFAWRDPHYQRQKCSPGILVSSKISFMRIFAGGSLEKGASNKSVIVESGDFRFFAHYICRLGDFKLHWNMWLWMTLNGYFALKYVFGSAFNGLAYILVFIVWKLAE